jgi:hypothetical protein
MQNIQSHRIGINIEYNINSWADRIGPIEHKGFPPAAHPPPKALIVTSHIHHRPRRKMTGLQKIPLKTITG